MIVSGRLRQRSYETKEGEKRTVYEIEVNDVGPSLRNASAKVNKMARSGGDGSYGTAASGVRAAGLPAAKGPEQRRRRGRRHRPVGVRQRQLFSDEPPVLSAC